MVWLRRKEGRVGVAIGIVGFCCCLTRDPVLSLAFGEMAIAEVGGTVVTDGAMLDFLPCRAGRLPFVSFRTEGALVCRVKTEGMAVELLDDAVLFFSSFTFAFEFALSALRRAGFFRGFLLGVILEGWILAAFAAVSAGVAMSIYLRDPVFLLRELVRTVYKNEPLSFYAMHCLGPDSRP